MVVRRTTRQFSDRPLTYSAGNSCCEGCVLRGRRIRSRISRIMQATPLECANAVAGKGRTSSRGARFDPVIGTVRPAIVEQLQAWETKPLAFNDGRLVQNEKTSGDACSHTIFRIVRFVREMVVSLCLQHSSWSWAWSWSRVSVITLTAHSSSRWRREFIVRNEILYILYIFHCRKFDRQLPMMILPAGTIHPWSHSRNSPG